MASGIWRIFFADGSLREEKTPAKTFQIPESLRIYTYTYEGIRVLYIYYIYIYIYVCVCVCVLHW